jgi:hypothetical protein
MIVHATVPLTVELDGRSWEVVSIEAYEPEPIYETGAHAYVSGLGFARKLPPVRRRIKIELLEIPQ